MPEYFNDANRWGIADKSYERSIADTGWAVLKDPETDGLLFYNQGLLQHSYEAIPDESEQFDGGYIPEGTVRGGHLCVWYWPNGQPQYAVRIVKYADNRYRRSAAAFANDGFQVAGRSALFKYKFLKRRGRLTVSVKRDRVAEYVPQWHFWDFENRDASISLKARPAAAGEHVNSGIFDASSLPTTGRAELVNPETGVTSVLVDGSLRKQSAFLVIGRLSRRQGILEETPTELKAEVDISYGPGDLPTRIEVRELKPGRHPVAGNELFASPSAIGEYITDNWLFADLDVDGEIKHANKIHLKGRRYGRHGYRTMATEQTVEPADEAMLQAILRLLSPAAGQAPSSLGLIELLPELPQWPPDAVLRKVSNL